MRPVIVLVLCALLIAALQSVFATATVPPVHQQQDPSNGIPRVRVFEPDTSTPEYRLFGSDACTVAPGFRLTRIDQVALNGYPSSQNIVVFPAVINNGNGFLSPSAVRQVNPRCVVHAEVSTTKSVWAALPDLCFEFNGGYTPTDKVIIGVKQGMNGGGSLDNIEYLDGTSLEAKTVPTVESKGLQCKPLSVVPLCTAYHDWDDHSKSFFRLFNPNNAPLLYSAFSEPSALMGSHLLEETIPPVSSVVIKVKSSTDKCCRKSLRVFAGGVTHVTKVQCDGEVTTEQCQSTTVEAFPRGRFELQDVDIVCPRKCQKDYPDAKPAHENIDEVYY